MVNQELNLNNTYYETLDENFKEALKLIERNFSHSELINLLKNGNIPQKQIAALKLDTINSQEEAAILLKNLTGQDGKIREAVSMRIAEFMNEQSTLEYFKNLKSYDIFLEAIIDINGNICRNTISAISNLKNSKEFCSYFCPKLIEKTNSLITEIEKFDLQDGKYKINKEVFKLYWCLETIYNFCRAIPIEQLKEILLKTKNINEYTIREKTAKILSFGFNDSDQEAAQMELKQDKNYYVRRF